MSPLVCCLILPPAVAEEQLVGAAAVLQSRASLLTAPDKDTCRFREDPDRALGFHTPMYPLSYFLCSVEWNFGLLYG